MKHHPHFLNILTVSSVFLFCALVVYLHALQMPAYDPLNQFMSELALGQNGFLMLFAFISLGIAIATAAIIVFRMTSSVALFGLMFLAFPLMVGAGIFKLGDHTNLHVALVATAFMALVLSMYLLPRASQNWPKLFSWSLGALTALSIALGHEIIPAGIAQRLASSFVCIWLCWIAFRGYRLRHTVTYHFDQISP